MGNIVTSLKIDETVWKQVRIRCIEKDIEYNQGVNEALRLWLKK